MKYIICIDKGQKCLLSSFDGHMNVISRKNINVAIKIVIMIIILY
jgi:hypothetical protein